MWHSVRCRSRNRAAFHFMVTVNIRAKTHNDSPEIEFWIASPTHISKCSPKKMLLSFINLEYSLELYFHFLTVLVHTQVYSTKHFVMFVTRCDAKNMNKLIKWSKQLFNSVLYRLFMFQIRLRIVARCLKWNERSRSKTPITVKLKHTMCFGVEMEKDGRNDFPLHGLCWVTPRQHIEWVLKRTLQVAICRMQQQIATKLHSPWIQDWRARARAPDNSNGNSNSVQRSDSAQQTTDENKSATAESVSAQFPFAWTGYNSTFINSIIWFRVRCALQSPMDEKPEISSSCHVSQFREP